MSNLISTPKSYDDLIVVDALSICLFDRTIFEEMKGAGLTLANCTCGVWENFADTMKNVAHWKRLFRENHDLIRQVKTIDDIEIAKKEGKVGIILSWQNTSGIDGNIDFLELYNELGVKCIQLTYNTQNLVGTGCYESVDNGLTDFGHNVVRELNRLGILIDLSHVGERGADQACDISSRPVAYTHCCPSSLKAHPRNKSDSTLKKIANKGGFVGVTIFPPLFPRRSDVPTVDDFVEVIEYMINLIGEEHVGIGTDFSQGQPWSFQEWVMHDQGNGRRLTNFGALTFPKGLERISDFPNIHVTMQKRGWSSSRIERVLGQNWLRLLRDVW